MLLSDLCVDIQEQVCTFLSTRDILALSACCWAQVGQRVLQSRENMNRDTGITVLSRSTNYQDSNHLKDQELAANHHHHSPPPITLHYPFLHIYKLPPFTF